MKKALLILLLSLHHILSAQSFEIRDGQFLLGGQPFRIYGGEMHYARIPREYWRHRILMAKAMGCNTLSIYVFWNYHETAPGVWDWTSDNHNLRAFIEAARAEGMYIILRPGPYTCAEWEFGGFPWWITDMKLRTADPAFLDSCRTYLQQVYKQVDGLFIEQGGNIIMTQVENEYGFFVFDAHIPLRKANDYKNKLLNIFHETGFTHTLFTCDGGILPVINFARLGHIKGIFPGTNDSRFLNVARHTVRKYFDKKGPGPQTPVGGLNTGPAAKAPIRKAGPYYIPEEYAGWFTHWGDAHVFHRDVEKYKAHIESLLKTDFSFCYYMVHGGTNFGFMNGSNSRRQNEVWPVITSYDYSAPIDEAGNATPLYDSLRAVYQRFTRQVLPEVPKTIPGMAIDSIKLNPIALFETALSIDTMDSARSFETMRQGYGFMVYRNNYDKGFHGSLSTDGVTDYALIYINDSLIATIDRNAAAGSVPKKISLDIPVNGWLQILVENLGRVNFGKKLYHNHRGATKGIVMSGQTSQDWVMTRLLMDTLPDLFMDYTSYKKNQPVYYTGSFTLDHTADTYLDMHGFGKGVVFVNGHNLGRYWEIGPQYSLYVPGVWLRQGRNEIVIFDEINHSRQWTISATAKPVNR